MALQILGPSWETLKGIVVDIEGKSSYVLRPVVDNTMHRLIVDVALEEKVKIVTLRSCNMIKNETELNLELGLAKAGEKKLVDTLKVSPGDYFHIPIDTLEFDTIFIRPAGKII